ncbi:unnamed protein product [Arabidopsis thaliana]|uniref:(thale cress) hypothetical protein n=1 Tax=Arabidopsis thaliana TaxID=3702 RepID=A0A7G2F5C3_ARATH|nr:unnamed protein product [Arabidopsis thaliana]
MGKVVLVSPSSSSSESEVSLVRRNSRLTGNPSNEAQSSRSNRIKIPTLLDEPDREGSGGHLAAPEDPVDFLAQFDPLIDLEDAYNTQPQYTEAEVHARLLHEDHVEFDLVPVVSWNTEITAKKTLSTTESVAEVFALCGSGDRPLTCMIPGENERPWNPPRGYVCMYEAYFRQCHLWFPIPSLIISFLNRRHMAFSQLTPAAICNFVAALTFGAEEGYLVNVRCFEEMTTLKAIRSPGYWVVNNRPKHNFLPGPKVSNFKNWEEYYFYVRVDLESYERPFSGRKRMWTEFPDRYRPSPDFPVEFEGVLEAIFRARRRTWKDVTRSRVNRIMGKVRKSFISFAAGLLNMPPPPAPIEEERQPLDGEAAASNPPVSAGPSGVDQVSHEMVNPESQDRMCLEGADVVPAQEIAECDRSQSVQVVEPEVQNITDDRSVVYAAPPAGEEVNTGLTILDQDKDETVAEPGISRRSREEKGKGGANQSKKRSASEAGLDEAAAPKTFRLSRGETLNSDQFTFKYSGEKFLVRDQEAASHLWRNLMLPGTKDFPNPDDLVLKEGYQKFARSSLETAALANDLIATYDRKLKLKLADREAFDNLKKCADQAKAIYAKDMKEMASLRDAAEIHKAEMSSLNDEVKRLNSREADLQKEFSDLHVALVAVKEHGERECNRLRNDRAAKVARTTKKAQARLDRVKAYLKEQEDLVGPKVDAENQARGAEEIVGILMQRGAKIAASELSGLKELTKRATDEVNALNVIELGDDDLNMSPDQLGFSRQTSQVAPVADQHGSNVDLSAGSSPFVGKNVPTFSNAEAIERGMPFFNNLRVPWTLLFQASSEERREAEGFLSCVESRHKEYREMLRYYDERRSDIARKMAMLESHPRHWLKNGFQLLAPMPDVLLSYCEDCDRDAAAVSKEKNPTIIADGNFIPRTPSLFYLGPAATDADTTECQNFVNQVGFLHQDQCRELQYFRTKKRSGLSSRRARNSDC